MAIAHVIKKWKWVDCMRWESHCNSAPLACESLVTSSWVFTVIQWLLLCTSVAPCPPVSRSRPSSVWWAACVFWSWTALQIHPGRLPSGLCVRCFLSSLLPVDSEKHEERQSTQMCRQPELKMIIWYINLSSNKNIERDAKLNTNAVSFLDGVSEKWRSASFSLWF